MNFIPSTATYSSVKAKDSISAILWKSASCVTGSRKNVPASAGAMVGGEDGRGGSRIMPVFTWRTVVLLRGRWTGIFRTDLKLCLVYKGRPLGEARR